MEIAKLYSLHIFEYAKATDTWKLESAIYEEDDRLISKPKITQQMKKDIIMELLEELQETLKISEPAFD